MPVFMLFEQCNHTLRVMLGSHQGVSCESKQEQDSHAGSQELYRGVLTFVPLNAMCSRK